jgi:putative tryptophan/tyrosine transport system substrate-binding protein
VRRREFIAGIGGAVAWPLVARAQANKRLPRVGVLMEAFEGNPEGQAEIAAFRRGLAALGWVEHTTIEVDVRWPPSNIEAIEASAAELLALKPDVLLARTTPGTNALKKLGGTTPIVFVLIAQPIEQGFVQSLAAPGGYLTGFTNVEESIGGKMLQLLREIDPRIVRVAVIYNPHTAPYAGFYLRTIESAARGLGMAVVSMPVQSDTAIEDAMAELARQPGGGMISIPDAFTTQHREQLISVAARNKIPAIYSRRMHTIEGGLMTYAADSSDVMQRVAGYADRILRGEKPADLPVQQPTRFNFLINLKTAASLGLSVPLTLHATADEVIE